MSIVKALLYQNIRNKMLIRIYILLLFAQMLFVCTNMGYMDEKYLKVLGSGGVLAGDCGLIFTMPFMFAGVFIGTLCGEDFKDKCAYYELLSGKGRLVSFLSRALFSVFANTLLMLLAGIVTVVFAKTAFDWGTFVSFKQMLAQTCLLTFPYLRYSAFLVLMTFIFRNPYIIYAIGFLMLSFLTVCEVALRDITDHASAFYEAIDLYNRFPIYTKTALTTGVVASAVAGIYLVIGYLVYKRSDLQ